LSAIVLGLVSSIGTRLQRQLAAESARLAVGDQLNSAAELLPLELRSLSPLAGDIAEARDTSLQFRSSLASGVVCGAAGSTLLLAPFLTAGARSVALTAVSGDTAWLLAPNDTTDRWQPLRIGAVRRANGGCPALDASGSAVFDVAHLWSLDVLDPVLASAGAIVRITRPVRYSVYHASDGRWYLGMRTWNVAATQFNTIQPVSGPYEPPGSGGTQFEYFDDAGAALPLGTDVSRIARIEVALRGQPATAGAPSAIDSVRSVIALRNRR
jgi:hypothetical protein